MRIRPRSARPWWVIVVVAGLLAAACTSEAPVDPESALVETVRDTFDGSFAYRVVAEADRDALEDLGRALGSVAARLNIFEVSGVVAGETITVDVAVFGTEPLLQVRRFGPEQLFVRVAAGDGPLGLVATPELEGRLLGVAVQTGQPDSVVAAIGALFNGDWIGVSGAFDASLLAGQDGQGTTEEPAGLATPLRAIITDYLDVADRVTEEGTTVTRVDLRVRELLRTLASVGGGLRAAGLDQQALEEGLAVIPEVVTGEVVTSEGVVQRIVFDVAQAAREAGEDVSGSLELRLELSEHGEPEIPPVPDAAVIVPSDELAVGLDRLLATPAPGEKASSTPDAQGRTE